MNFKNNRKGKKNLHKEALKTHFVETFFYFNDLTLVIKSIQFIYWWGALFIELYAREREFMIVSFLFEKQHV